MVEEMLSFDEPSVQRPPAAAQRPQRPERAAGAPSMAKSVSTPWWVLWCYGVGALALGVPAWIANAVFSRDALVTVVNLFVGWLGFTERLVMPTGWIGIGIAFGVGLIWSIIERFRPARAEGQRMAVWIIIIIVDHASTALGSVAQFSPDVWAAAWWHWIIGIVAAVLLTLPPDRFIVRAVTDFRNGYTALRVWFRNQRGGGR